MQPVDPSTMVRGPAALTMSFMTNADSHPWQVRWPEGKEVVGCVGECGRLSRGLPSSFTYAKPVGGLALGFAGCGRSVADFGGFIDVFQRDLPAPQPADEADERRPVLGVIERCPELRGPH